MINFVLCRILVQYYVSCYTGVVLRWLTYSDEVYRLLLEPWEYKYRHQSGKLLWICNESIRTRSTDALCSGRKPYDDFKYFVIYEYFIPFCMFVLAVWRQASVPLKQLTPLAANTKYQYASNTIYEQKFTCYNTNKYVSHAAYFWCWVESVHSFQSFLLCVICNKLRLTVTRNLPSSYFEQFLCIFLLIKPTRCINFSSLFLEWNSTCFGQFLCPSARVFHCTHSNGLCHTGHVIQPARKV